MMLVNEIFTSLQGEGVWTGTPMTFVRLQDCNLSCPWCDTPGALDPMGGKWMELDQVKKAIVTRAPRRVCFTGGEPLLQAPEVARLIRELRHVRRFHIETNGTMSLPELPVKVWLTVSPKPPLYRIEHKRIDELKMVITRREDIDILFDLLGSQAMADAYIGNVCLQPVDNDPEIIRMCTAVLEGNRGINWRLSVQLHKMLKIR